MFYFQSGWGRGVPRKYRSETVVGGFCKVIRIIGSTSKIPYKYRDFTLFILTKDGECELPVAGDNSM